MNLLQQLLHDEDGFIISAELVIIATVLILGLVVGLKCVQAAITGELKDVAGAIGSLNQSYSYSGFSKRSIFNCEVKAFTRGSAFLDQQDGDVAAYQYDIGDIERRAVPHPEAVTPCPPDALMEPDSTPTLRDSAETNEVPLCPPGRTLTAPGCEACPEAAVPQKAEPWPPTN